MKAVRVAAVQMRAQVGAVARNLASAEALAEEAFRQGARWVILPEFFPSAMAFTPAMLSAWQPQEGPALQLMRRLARKHDGIVGGSFIAQSGKDCFNSFLLVFPDGRYFRHDKDPPRRPPVRSGWPCAGNWFARRRRAGCWEAWTLLSAARAGGICAFPSPPNMPGTRRC